MKAFSLIETIVSVGLLTLLIPPFVLFTNHYYATTHSERTQIDNSLNIDYVINSIQEELSMITFIENDFQPKNLVDSNLIQFRHPNGKIVRYYKVGEELVKDFNYVGYNAVTPKIIQRFQIRRTDQSGYLCLDILIQDKEGHVYERKITKKI